MFHSKTISLLHHVLLSEIRSIFKIRSYHAIACSNVSTFLVSTIEFVYFCELIKSKIGNNFHLCRPCIRKTTNGFQGYLKSTELKGWICKNTSILTPSLLTGIQNTSKSNPEIQNSLISIMHGSLKFCMSVLRSTSLSLYV